MKSLRHAYNTVLLGCGLSATALGQSAPTADRHVNPDHATTVQATETVTQQLLRHLDPRGDYCRFKIMNGEHKKLGVIEVYYKDYITQRTQVDVADVEKIQFTEQLPQHDKVKHVLTNKNNISWVLNSSEKTTLQATENSADVQRFTTQNAINLFDVTARSFLIANDAFLVLDTGTRVLFNKAKNDPLLVKPAVPSLQPYYK